jgi:SAM-dependent methyltransferase
MAACTECPICDHPGKLSDASEVAVVPCNVRSLKDHRFKVWRCSGCGSLHCVEDVNLEPYYAAYPLKQQKLGFHERIGYRNRQRALESAGLRRSHSILDFGCGAGLFVNFLREQGFAHASGYDRFVSQYANPQALDKQYDAVVSYDVIEHDDDTRQCMRSLSRLVRPGGLLAIGTPNADNVSTARTADPSLHMPYHRHILSERVLLGLGKDSGLTPVHISRRSFYDSLIPTVNSRFMWRLIEKSGGFLDAAVEPPNIARVLGSPELLFFAFFGYFTPAGDNMLVIFRKPAEAHPGTSSQQPVWAAHSDEVAVG